LLAFCWRRVIRRRVQSHTFACSARPQPPRRQPCARVRLARLWAVLDVVSIFSHHVSYTYPLPSPQYIYPSIPVRSREHGQRLKAGTNSLGGQSSSHHSNVDCYSSGDQRGQRLERCECDEHTACKTSRRYPGRRRSICLRFEEPHYLVYHPGKNYQMMSVTSNPALTCLVLS
jgi:hypothetical protein